MFRRKLSAAAASAMSMIGLGGAPPRVVKLGVNPAPANFKISPGISAGSNFPEMKPGTGTGIPWNGNTTGTAQAKRDKRRRRNIEKRISSRK